MNVYEKLSDPVAFAVFLLTLFLPVLVGLLTIGRTRTQSDFYIGGRAMDKLVVALSAVSSGRSSWLVLGVSGMAYKMGVGAVWAVVGYVTVELFQFIYVGRRLRAQTEEMGSITLLDYFESRFNDSRHLLRATGAVIIAIFLTAYVAAQLNAGAKSLSIALEIPLLISLVISAAVILIYIVLGGYIAVAYNDVVRAVIMLVALVVLPVLGLIKIGGLGALLETLQALQPEYIDPLALGAGAIIGFLGIGLGSPGQPHIVVRYMSIEDPDKLRSSAVIGTFWNVILGWGALIIGLLARAMFPAVESLTLDQEMAYLMLSSELFGPALYGLLVGGIFAAILSTADSQLLVVASTFSRDIYEKIVMYGRPIDERKKLMLSRLVVVVAGLVAMVLAYLAKDLVFWLVLFAWGGLGASFGTALILSLYWPRTGKYGVLCGFVTGTLITIVWKLWLKEPTGIYELIPAFIGSALVIVVVSLLEKPVKDEGVSSDGSDAEPGRNE
jgi:sodium/proline symporter